MEFVWSDVLLWIAKYGTFATVGVPAVIELIFSKIYQPLNKTASSILTFVIALLSTFAVWLAGMWFDVGFLVDVTEYWHVIVYGLGAGLVANWTWVNIDWVKAIITLIIKGDKSVLMAKRK